MSLSDIITIADKIETALAGKQPIAPIITELRSGIADFQLALAHFDKALAGIAAIAVEVQPAPAKPNK